jgi:hypothetical protein
MTYCWFVLLFIHMRQWLHFFLGAQALVMDTCVSRVSSALIKAARTNTTETFTYSMKYGILLRGLNALFFKFNFYFFIHSFYSYIWDSRCIARKPSSRTCRYNYLYIMYILFNIMYIYIHVYIYLYTHTHTYTHTQM